MCPEFTLRDQQHHVRITHPRQLYRAETYFAYKIERVVPDLLRQEEEHKTGGTLFLALGLEMESPGLHDPSNQRGTHIMTDRGRKRAVQTKLPGLKYCLDSVFVITHSP